MSFDQHPRMFSVTESVDSPIVTSSRKILRLKISGPNDNDSDQDTPKRTAEDKSDNEVRSKTPTADKKETHPETSTDLDKEIVLQKPTRKIYTSSKSKDISRNKPSPRRRSAREFVIRKVLPVKHTTKQKDDYVTDGLLKINIGNGIIRSGQRSKSAPNANGQPKPEYYPVYYVSNLAGTSGVRRGRKLWHSCPDCAKQNIPCIHRHTSLTSPTVLQRQSTQ